MLTTADLVDLVIRLSHRVNELQRQLIPFCESGDAQEDFSNNVLPQPIKVRVCDSNGNPLEKVVVRFRAVGGGGHVGSRGCWRGSEDAKTNADGFAETRWRVGHHGLQTVEAAVALDQPDHKETRSVGRHVKFIAWANSKNLVTPVVQRVQPWDATPPDWPEHPELTLQFNRPMREDQLAGPDAWLRVWAVTPCDGQGTRVDVQRLELTYVEQSELHASTPQERSWLVRYDICPHRVPLSRPFVRFLVTMRAHGANIQSIEGVLLDPTFAGTRLEWDQVLNVWNTDAKGSATLPIPYDRFDASGHQLPSGDGRTGGLFHSVFRLPEKR